MDKNLNGQLEKGLLDWKKEDYKRYYITAYNF